MKRHGGRLKRIMKKPDVIMGDVKEQISVLTQRTAQLNALRDELSDLYFSLEEVLQDLGLGVSAWYVAGRCAVGYSRLGGRWRIIIQDRHDKSDIKDWDQWPCNEAPTYLRIDAVSWLPMLLETMVVRSDEMILKCEKAVTKIKKVLETARTATTTPTTPGP
jgi:hypothetical protein